MFTTLFDPRPPMKDWELAVDLGWFRIFETRAGFPIVRGWWSSRQQQKRSSQKSCCAPNSFLLCLSLRVNFFGTKPGYVLHPSGSSSTKSPDRHSKGLPVNGIAGCVWMDFPCFFFFSKEDIFWVQPPPSKQSIGIQSYSQLMLGVSSHLLSIVFRFHYHS